MPIPPMGGKSVNLDRCRLVPFVGEAVDLSGNVTRIDLYENLFSPVLTGKIAIQDSESLTTRLGMFGAELFSLQFSVHDSSKNAPVSYGNDTAPLLFMAYSQTHRVPHSFGSEMFTLNLTSAEMYSSAGIKISRAFKNMKVENIIKEMLNQREYIGTANKQFFANTTATPVNMVTPYLSPLEIIRLATLMANNEKETNYVFYETLKGFHFESIRQMVERSSNGYVPTLTRGVAGLTESKANLSVIPVEQIDLVTGYDLLSLSTGGYFASVTFGVDILSGKVRKSIGKSNQTSPIVNPSGILNMPPAIADVVNPTSRIFVVPTLSVSAADAKMKSLDTSIYDNKIEQTLDGRNRELMALGSRVIRIKLAGVPNIHAGSLVNVVFPSPVNNNKTVVEMQDVATGRYLVVAVTHSIVAGPVQGFFYETTIEACSDSVL